MQSRGRGVVALCLVFALAGVGAAPVPAGAQEALCIPLLMKCASPSPSPSPAPSPTGAPGSSSGGAPSGPLGGIGSLLGGGSSAGDTLTQVVAAADPNAPIMTLPAAQLGGSSISFSGLQAVSVVTVPLANGTRTPVIKLVADSITIDDFVLDVRSANSSGGLVTTAGRMELRGNVTAYLDSVSGNLVDGTGVTFGAATPPTGNELPSTLLRVTLGLVGVTANSITLTPSEQTIKE